MQEDPLEIEASDVMTQDLKDIVGSQISWLNPMDIETNHGVEGCFSHGHLRFEGFERGDRDHDEERESGTLDRELHGKHDD